MRYASTSRAMGMAGRKEVGGKEQRAYYDSGVLLYMVGGCVMGNSLEISMGRK
jgi:hypothetical protein